MVGAGGGVDPQDRAEGSTSLQPLPGEHPSCSLSFQQRARGRHGDRPGGGFRGSCTFISVTMQVRQRPIWMPVLRSGAPVFEGPRPWFQALTVVSPRCTDPGRRRGPSSMSGKTPHTCAGHSLFIFPTMTLGLGGKLITLIVTGQPWALCLKVRSEVRL